jgi:hypothetical protein
MDLAPIRTNYVVLGAIQTPLLDIMSQGHDLTEQWKAATLVKSVGTPDEAAEAYLYSMVRAV